MAAPEGQIRRLSVKDSRLLKPITPGVKFINERREVFLKAFATARFVASLVAIVVAVRSVRTENAVNVIEK